MVKKLFLLAVFCLLPLWARAETLSCKFFSVNMPDGWQAVTPPTEQMGMTNAVFVKGAGNPSVSLLVGETAGTDIQTIARIFAEQYKADKAPMQKNGRYYFNFSRQKQPCQAWIAVQNSVFMVTTLVGNPREGLRFMKEHVSSTAFPGLLPQ